MRNVQTTLSYKWYQEAWNNGRSEALDELLDENIIAWGLGPDRCIKGVSDFKKFYTDFKNQVSNVQVIVEDVISQDDVESAHCSVKAVHTASKKNVDFTGISMVKIVNGKIAEAWNQFDFLRMYQQAGYALTML
jgi:hypothetical protein